MYLPANNTAGGGPMVASPMLSPATTLPTSAQAVQQRLQRQGLVIRSVWFPTKAELTAWEQAGTPLYVRPLAVDHIELGPRLGSMWASVFSPVLVGRFTDHQPGCSVRWSRRLPRLTTAVLGLWVLILIGWSITLLSEPKGLLFWALLVAATGVAPVVGWVRGGRALNDGIPWLDAVLMAEDEEEDW